MIPQRLSCLRSLFPSLRVDALLVVNDTHIRYLTGFPSAESWLLITGQKAFFITDFRYTLQARKALKGFRVVQYQASLFETVLDLAEKERVRVLGVDERHLSVFQMRRLKAFGGKTVRFKAADHAVDVLRSLKDREEVNLIRQAIRINFKAFDCLRKSLRAGMRERDVFYRMEEFIRDHEVGFSFPPIIASGPNSAFPHAGVSERKLRRNEPLLIDLGIELNGYKSDLTRMFFLGKMTPSFGKVHALVRQAQEEAFKVIRPGIMACEVDQAARGFLAKHGLAGCFGHSLGHGVGLDVHENPRISQKSGEVLMEGMVITIEPGVYFPGKYGIRQEDMVLVTKTGCEVLSDFDY